MRGVLKSLIHTRQIAHFHIMLFFHTLIIQTNRHIRFLDFCSLVLLSLCVTSVSYLPVHKVSPSEATMQRILKLLTDYSYSCGRNAIFWRHQCTNSSMEVIKETEPCLQCAAWSEDKRQQVQSEIRQGSIAIEMKAFAFSYSTKLMGCKLSLQPPSALSQAVAALPPCSYSVPDVPQPDPPADVLAPQVIISCYTAVLFLSFKLVGSHLGARQLLPPGSQAFWPSVSTLPSAAWGLSSFWQPFQKCIWEVHSPHISFPNATLPSRLEPCRTYPTSLKPEEHQPPAWWLAGAGEAALQPLQQPAELVKSPNAFRNQAPSNGTTWFSSQQSALNSGAAQPQGSPCPTQDTYQQIA